MWLRWRLKALRQPKIASTTVEVAVVDERRIYGKAPHDRSHILFHAVPIARDTPIN